MTFTKRTALHDKITIDSDDFSNAFNEFGFSSENTNEDLSGFSVSGVDELEPGRTAESFAGNMFYTEEVAAAIWPLHKDKTEVEITWQPNGLIDSGAITYYALCTINTFSPQNRRGNPSTFPFSATPADENGIRALGT